MMFWENDDKTGGRLYSWVLDAVTESVDVDGYIQTGYMVSLYMVVFSHSVRTPVQ